MEIMSKLLVAKASIKKITDFFVNSYTSIKDKMGEIVVSSKYCYDYSFSNETLSIEIVFEESIS